MRSDSNAYRKWHRRHVNGVYAVILRIRETESWLVRVARSYSTGRELGELLGEFDDLRAARAAADRRAQEILVHDCSLCQRWTPGTPRRP